MADEDRQITGGGGIVRGSGQRSASPNEASVPSEFALAFRRRWTSGIAVMTLRDGNAFRGITLTGVLPHSIDPPLIAVSLTADGSFAGRIGVGRRCALSILQGDQVFLSERFAGRAPVPDAAFTGVPHELDDHGVPIIVGATASVSGVVISTQTRGDHRLVIVEIDDGAIGAEDDDPLVTYDGGYRRLEVS